MIDSHCHLDDVSFDDDRPSALDRAFAAGVTDIVIPAVAEASWIPIIALASRSSPVRLHAAVGLHPVAVPELPELDDEALLERLDAVLTHHRPVAVGECGLDTTIDLSRAPIDRQERLLAGQLALARRHQLPVILHARGPGCYARLADFLDAHRLPERGGVVHSYGGGAGLLSRFVRHRLLFGIAGPVTYPGARKVCATVAAIPDERLLVETDAPDQTPVPFKPGRCEPAHLPPIIAAVAAVRGREAADIARCAASNARRLFGLPGAEWSHV